MTIKQLRNLLETALQKEAAVPKETYPETAAEYARQINDKARERGSLGGLVTDGDYWTRLGIHTGEQLARYLAIEDYINVHKEVYGFKPRGGVDFDSMSIDDITAAVDAMYNDIDYMERDYNYDYYDYDYYNDIDEPPYDPNPDPLAKMEPSTPGYEGPHHAAPKMAPIRPRGRRRGDRGRYGESIDEIDLMDPPRRREHPVYGSPTSDKIRAEIEEIQDKIGELDNEIYELDRIGGSEEYIAELEMQLRVMERELDNKKQRLNRIYMMGHSDY